MRLLEDGLLGGPEVEQGLRFLHKQLTNLHTFSDPRSNHESQQLWLANSFSLSMPPSLFLFLSQRVFWEELGCRGTKGLIMDDYSYPPILLDLIGRGFSPTSIWTQHAPTKLFMA